jgi:glycosyltransferase involved in cell wall biosynthesis
MSVPPGDPAALAGAIVELANQPALCRKMGMNGRKMVESHFSRKQLANQFADLLEMMRSKNV